MKRYLRIVGSVGQDAHLPAGFFMERGIRPEDWVGRGWLGVAPIGERTPCRYCGNLADVRTIGEKITARCPVCGSYELTAAERVQYAVRGEPVLDAIVAGLGCKGERNMLEGGILRLGRAAVAGQSRVTHFLRGVTAENLEVVQKLLGANKLHLLFCCGDFTEDMAAEKLSGTQFFPLGELLSESTGGISFDREGFLLRFRAAEVDKPKEVRISSEESFYRKKVIHELTSHFYSVRSAYESAERNGVKFTVPRRPTQALLAKLVGTYPVMIHRVIEKDVGARMMYENAENLNFILGYLKNPIFGTPKGGA